MLGRHWSPFCSFIDTFHIERAYYAMLNNEDQSYRIYS